MIQIGISGAMGRMGKTIAHLCREHKDIKIALALEHPEHPDLNQDYGILLNTSNLNIPLSSNKQEIQNIDVLIDFTLPENTIDIIKFCADYKKPIVIGTTGFTKEQKEILYSYKDKIPVLISPNMSLGVNVLFYLVKQATKLLKEYEVEISEIHHSKKKDAPSGTAVRLKDIILEEYNLTENNVIYGRKGIVGERKLDELGIHAIRGGDVVGEHTVYFFSQGERIEITHKATSRDIFARGAIVAAKWILNQKPGLYSMNHVLGIENI
ncbi:MAG: 4-hydroxy-tetrahydrodipicolinate reductase [Leptospiraceae bacterium]|nr:MAG: 4-hydroxy-tetrahydrodipicolinate reductase [Leptospiraceae bacterium]